jgi:hypothetical protein
MYEQILADAPQLGALERKLEELHADRAEAYGRATGLVARVAQAEEHDLTAAASALNRGRSRPKAEAPKIREQLEQAQADLALLDKRIQLVEQERSEYIANHGQELFALLAAAHRQAANTVARLAGQTLEYLLLMYKTEDDGRQLQRVTAEPPEENWGAPAPVTNLDVASGVIGTAREAGPQRGEIESTLRLLQSYGEATEIGAAPSEDDVDPAAVMHAEPAREGNNGSDASGAGAA